MKRRQTFLQFEYPEDQEFFCIHIASGNPRIFQSKFAHLFDFRPAAIKRREFSKIQKLVLKKLRKKYGDECQLKLHPDCSKNNSWEPDHIIPLSSNNLNKQLRKLPRIGKAKVLSQSFGSNHIDNLTLACKRCNAAKKNLLLPAILSNQIRKI